MQNLVISGKKTTREETLAGEILTERERTRTNLHNFTLHKPAARLQQLLNKSGGFVPKDFQSTSELGLLKTVKRLAEEAVLAYAVSIAGERERRIASGRKKKKTNKYNSTRASIRYYMTHPNMSNADRDFICKSLKLIDRLKIILSRKYKSMLPLNNNVIRKMPELDQLRDVLKFNSNPDIILRESDKKMGWSLNSTQWYQGEYKRQSATHFYLRVGTTEAVFEIRKNCREKLYTFLTKHKAIIGPGGILKFCSRKIEEYPHPA